MKTIRKKRGGEIPNTRNQKGGITIDPTASKKITM